MNTRRFLEKQGLFLVGARINSLHLVDGFPVLALDTGVRVFIQNDDEGNGPGAMGFTDPLYRPIDVWKDAPPNMPMAFDRKNDAKVIVVPGMRLKFIDKGGDVKDKLAREQLDTCFEVRDVSVDASKRRLVHFTDGTHTSHPENMEVWYDDLHKPVKRKKS